MIRSGQTAFGVPLNPDTKPGQLKSEQAKRTTAPIYSPIAKDLHDPWASP